MFWPLSAVSLRREFPMDQIHLPSAAAIPSTSPGTQYEFNESENAVFTGLAKAMKLVSTVALSLGALMVVGFFVLLFRHRIGHASLSLIQGMVMVVMGIWNRDASGSVEQIVSSTGNDVTHLMQAMDKLKKIFSLTQTLLLATILLAGLSFFIGLE